MTMSEHEIATLSRQEHVLQFPMPMPKLFSVNIVKDGLVSTFNGTDNQTHGYQQC